MEQHQTRTNLWQYLLRGLEWASKWYDEIESAVVRTVYGRILPSAVANRLELISIFRRLVKLSALIAVIFIAAAILFLSPKLLTVSGMLFDLAGLARIFIDEEWEDITALYSNTDDYPYGPPSHVTRELFRDDNPDAIGEVSEEFETIARHLYWRRGLALVILGFVLQLVGTVLS